MDRRADAVLADIRSLRTELGGRARASAAQARAAASAASALASLRAAATGFLGGGSSGREPEATSALGRVSPVVLLAFGILLGLQALLARGGADTR